MSEETRHTFIQWKGTEVCMDVYCPKCGVHGHIDAEFAYAVRCGGCGTTYQVGDEVKLTPLEAGRSDYLGYWFDHALEFHDDDEAERNKTQEQHDREHRVYLERMIALCQKQLENMGPAPVAP